MTTRRPKISVAIPSYNGAEFLGRSLQSVLGQSFHDFEVVISDDGSIDGTIDTVNTFDDDRLRIHPGKRIGASHNWNRAILLTRGQFVKLLPQDDLLHPECLKRQLAILQSHPAIGMTACKRNVIGPDDRILLTERGLSGLHGTVTPDTALRAIVRSGTNIIGEAGSVMMRREAFDDAGGFNGRRPYVIDLDLWVRVIQKSGLHAEQAALASFRVSPNAWTAKLSSVQTDQIRELFREIRSDSRNNIGYATFALGWAKAGLLTPARRAIYKLVARRNRPLSL